MVGDTTVTTTFNGKTKVIHGFMRQVSWDHGYGDPVSMRFEMVVGNVTDGEPVELEADIGAMMRHPEDSTLDALEWLANRIDEVTAIGGAMG